MIRPRALSMPAATFMKRPLRTLKPRSVLARELGEGRVYRFSCPETETNPYEIQVVVASYK